MPGAESAVLDASVAVKWIVQEPHSDAVTTLLDRHVAWVAPRLMLVESASALRRKVEARELRPETASSALAVLLDAVRYGRIRLVEDESVVADALLLALQLPHRLPDCVYLAVAEQEGIALSTADVRLATVARSRKIVVLGIGAAAH